MSERQVVSIVVPAFNEEAVIEQSYRRLKAVGESLAPLDYELIMVDDGSRDATWARLQQLAAADRRLRVLRFSRNFGHQVAITAGIDHARGDAVVVIDADLQDPPEVIPEMVAQWRAGYDVVYGVRRSRKGEGPVKLATAALFYRLLNRVTSVEIPVDVGDFRLLSRRAADQLRAMREKDRFVRGLVAWIGMRQTGVSYVREARFAGETKYPWRKMLRFAIDGMTSFSTLPLRFATWLGFLASLLAFAYLATVFVQKLLGITVQGWATIMVAMLFLGGVQLVCLGIIGEYIGRIFNEIKQRPLYIIDASLNQPN